jgi:hypothetical protein
MAQLDLDDPALPSIAAAVAEMREAGAELNEGAVELAIRLGRHRWASRVKPSPRSARVKPEPIAGSIVYYIRRGSVAKIGTTTRPYDRFVSLMPDEVLAFEPGGFALEKLRHNRFAHLRIGASEHFRIAAELMDWTAKVRDTNGDPDPGWPTVATLDRMHRGKEALTPPPPPKSPTLVTATEGADECGLKRNTVQTWAHRGVLRPVGTNSRGRTVFFLDDVLHFAACSSATPRPAESGE